MREYKNRLSNEFFNHEKIYFMNCTSITSLAYTSQSFGAVAFGTKVTVEAATV